MQLIAVKEKSAKKIMQRRRWPKVTGWILAAVTIVFTVLSIYWSRSPDIFWVTHTVDE